MMSARTFPTLSLIFFMITVTAWHRQHWSECHSLSRVFPASHTTRLTFVTRLGKTSKHILSADGEHFRKFIRKLLGKMFQKHLKYIKF